MEGDFEYPKHQHTNYEAILVERGPYRCELNGDELTLAAGQVLLIKPGDWHQDHLRDGQRHYVLHFRLFDSDPGTPAPPVFRPDARAAEQISRGDHARDALFLRELRREAEEGHAHAGAVQDGLLDALFWRIVRDLEPEALSPEFRRLPAEETQREQLVRVLLRHLQDNPLMADLAHELKMSPRQLSKRCRALYGVSPARLLLRLKLERAEALLRYRGLQVKEVSDALGFTNPFHFSRVFRRHRGVPPSASKTV
jgi:AraC-like DNA-binding protein